MWSVAPKNIKIVASPLAEVGQRLVKPHNILSAGFQSGIEMPLAPTLQMPKPYIILQLVM